MIGTAPFLARLATRALFIVLGASVGYAQFAPGVASAAPQTWTFTYDGPQVQHFTVPNGVTQLSAIVTGAAGGQTNNQIATPGGGGVTIATLAVTPGQQFTIWVGGNGNGGDGKGGGGWGFGCGGARGTTGNPLVKNGGGGGGGSAIVFGNFTNNDCASVASVTTAPLLVVAGGGGGGGGFGAQNGAFANKENDQGGAGGAGGNIGGQGVNGSFSPGPGVTFGGCGGNANNDPTCQPPSSTPTGTNGRSTPFPTLGGGGGGGGGGFLGGGGGFFGIPYGGPPALAPGGGGGGGLSVASGSAAVSDVAYLSGGPGVGNNGVAPGRNGSVVLTTNQVRGFTARATSFNPPAGTTQMEVYLEGANGGQRSNSVNLPVNSALGSPGGSMKATFPFVPSQQPYFVFIGLYGSQHGGGGYSAGGDQGQVGGSSNGFDGGGGGGSSGFSIHDNFLTLLVAGGGGGGGGDGTGRTGGVGGAWCGGNGAPGNQGGGHGGTGGAASTINGDNGGSSAAFAGAGAGGGGGGGGPQGGRGGDGGIGIPVLGTGSGGGGGGAGDCQNDGSAIDPTAGFGSVAGDGIAIVTFIADPSIAVVLPVLAKPIAMHGQARNIGDGNPDGVVRIEGKLSMPNSLSLDQHLDQATFTLTKLLTEVSGKGELSRVANHARHLPITLQALAKSRPDDAVYETAPGATPKVRVELRGKQEGGLLAFRIHVENAAIDLPLACSNTSLGTVQIETSFDIHNGSQLLRVDTTVPWQCNGGELLLH